MKYKKAKTAADHSAAYRARQPKKERVKKEPKERAKRISNKDKSKWKYGQFIALDGEGESSAKSDTFKIEGGKTYHAKEHFYTLLAASTGESLFNGGKRLDSQTCVDFLCDLSLSYPKGIFVIFAGGYDVNHMLLFGFNRDAIRGILGYIYRDGKWIKPSGGQCVYTYEYNNIKYEIEYRSRKSLTIRRGVEFYRDKNNKWKKTCESKITVWDVFGFFQESFVGVMGKWLGKNHRHYELIKDMKTRRGDFANIEQSKINAYNAAELETLAELMEKVREAIDGLGLQCKRWDGAGAVAAAIMQKHNIKEFKAPTNSDVINAVRCAYAGGRIEVCKIGNHSGPVYDYDVNSAYPSIMQSLPCLLHGFWQHGNGNPPDGFTIVHVRFEFPFGMPFYPLFFRTDKMQISFPRQGEGWYWMPEYEAAKIAGGKLEVLEYYHWVADCNHKPFHWIPEYYNTRQKWVKNPTEEWQKGGEKIIKLGLNSLYGKTAQQLGGTKDKPPVYHQLEWAGYITSGIRAKLFTAAMTSPQSIIGFATDGIFSTEKLPIELSITKEIGAWELKEPVPVGLTIAMAGVYWWHHDDGTFGHYSRGFDKDAMLTPDNVLAAWKRGKNSLDIPMHRLIGMGTAAGSDTFWKMRGRFTEGMRTLNLDGKSHKRYGCSVRKDKPHLQLVDLYPTENSYIDCSYPYPVRWLDGEVTDDYQNDLEQQKENSDTENI